MSWLPWTREKSESIDRRRSLTGVPIINESISLEEGANGRVIVDVPLKRKPGMGWLARFTPTVVRRRVKLDELGTFVIRQIDGKRSAKDIIDIFAAKYKVNRREAELSCIEFLKMLATRHIISVVIK